MARSSQPQHYLAAGCVFGVFGSLAMGPSWIWIFLKINIFLFEDLKSQDFLDPYFSDTCMWVQDPSKWGYFQIMDSPTLKGPGPTYMCQKNMDPKNPGGSNAQIEIYLFS